MADEYNPQPAEDGVQEAPLRQARAWLTRLIDDALIDGKTSALTDRGRRRVYLVPPRTFGEDRRNQALAEALQKAEPELYARLLTEIS
jgi:hypothetical protein